MKTYDPDQIVCGDLATELSQFFERLEARREAGEPKFKTPEDLREEASIWRKYGEDDMADLLWDFADEEDTR